MIPLVWSLRRSGHWAGSKVDGNQPHHLLNNAATAGFPLLLGLRAIRSLRSQTACEKLEIHQDA